jgi:DNA-binding NtrC family response regulator
MILSPSLLITDDDADLRESLRAVFEPRGFRAIQAANGEEALVIVQREPVHLMLLDLHMPRLGGLETLRRVKTIKALLPCIVMSGSLNDRLAEEVEQAHAFCVLRKPVTRDQVTSVVDQAMWRAYQWRRS